MNREQRRRAPKLTPAARQSRLRGVETAAAAQVADRASVMAMLARLPGRRAALDARQRELVDQARELGVGWPLIGAALLVTPQAVQKRYG